MASSSKEYELAVRIAGSVSSSFNSAISTAEGKVTSLGSIAKKAAAVAAAAWGALKIGEFVSDAVDTYSEFDQAMANTAAICGATADEYAALEAAALEMGKATTKTATECSEALGYMSLAGWSVSDSIASLEPILRLSEATQMDLATCSDLVTDSMSALGIEIADLSTYLDVAAMANNKSNQTAQMLMEAYIGVGGTMKNLNVPIQESAAALGVMANRGIKGSEAGTALNAVINNLTTGTGQAGKMMEKLGISAFDSNGNFIGLAETIQVVNEATKDMTEEERNAALAAIGGKQHIDTLNALMSGLNTTTADGVSEWAALSDALYNSDGALATMADTVTDTLSGAMSRFGSAVDDAKIRLVQVFAPMAKDAINTLSAVIPTLTDKVQAFAENLSTNVVPRVKSFVERAIGLFNEVKPTLETIATKAGEAFTFISTTVGDAVRGVAEKIEQHRDIIDKIGEVAERVGTALWNAFEEAKPAIEYVGNTLIPAAADGLLTMADTILDVILHIGDFKEELIAAAAVYGAFKVGSGIQKIATAFGNAQVSLKLFTMSTKNANIAQSVMNGTLSIGEGIVALFTGQTTIAQLAQAAWSKVTKAFTAVQTAMNTVLSANPIGLIITAIVAVIAIVVVLYKKCDWFRNGVNKILTAVGNAFKKLWEVIKKAWDKIVQSLQPLIDAISGAFQEAWELIQVIWDMVGPYFTAIWNAIKAVFSVVKDFFVARFKVAWEGIKLVWAVAVSYFQTIWENIKLVFSVVKTFFSGMFSTAWEAIKTVWNAVVGYFAAIWNTIKGIFSVVKSVLTGDFQGAWEGIKGIVSTWTSYFSGVWSGIKNVFSKVGSWFSSTFSSAWNAIKGIFSNWSSFFSGLIDKIKSAFSKATSIMSTPIENAKNLIKSAFDKIKSFVNFKWSLPALKLPHISVTGGVAPFGIGGKGSLPKFSIQWYKDGGILDGAQIFGAAGGNLLGGGEAGKEAVLPLTELWKNMRYVMSDVLQRANSSTIGTAISTINDKLQSARTAGSDTLLNALNALLGGKDDPQPALAGGPGGAGYQITYSPVYQFYGEAPSKDDLTDAARMSQAEFNAMMDEYLKDKDRKDF